MFVAAAVSHVALHDSMRQLSPDSHDGDVSSPRPAESIEVFKGSKLLSPAPSFYHDQKFLASRPSSVSIKCLRNSWHR